jgi:DNA replication protein DnaC
MLDEATVRQLHEMRLPAMAEAFTTQSRDASMSDLTFNERFGLLVDAEWSSRKSNKLTRLIASAKFPLPEACVEGVEYFADRKLDKEQIRALASCDYIDCGQNVILVGASGAGKTYLGCALGLAACRKYCSTRYVRLPDLLLDLEVARGEGVFKKSLAAYVKPRLLLIDEWLLLSVRETDARDILEVVDGRCCRHGSTIFMSQFAAAGWHAKLGAGPLADAILDRIVHNAHFITMAGDESMRQRKGIA